MTEQVQQLIDKIKKEGLDEAQNKARQVVDEAEKKAAGIVQEARREAERLKATAQEENQRHEASGRAALTQAARDMVLDLRKQIEAALRSVLNCEIRSSLDGAQLGQLIETAIVKYIEAHKDVSDVSVTLSAGDLKKLKEGFIGKLKEKIKQPIVFQGEEDINAGFTISFDEGKTRFDFSDESLAQYLGGYLNKELAAILKEAASS